MVAKRPQDNVTALPTKVHYSLLQDQELPKEDFVVELSEGVTITLTDPTELSIERLAGLTNPLGFLADTTPDEETRTVLRELSSRDFGKVMKAYFAHFGIEADATGKPQRPF
jgi:hypothetical protein